MEMKNPVHPGALIMECLDNLGLSVAAAAKGLGITRQQLHNVITGRSGVTPEMAIRLEKAFGKIGCQARLAPISFISEISANLA